MVKAACAVETAVARVATSIVPSGSRLLPKKAAALLSSSTITALTGVEFGTKRALTGMAGSAV